MKERVKHKTSVEVRRRNKERKREEKKKGERRKKIRVFPHPYLSEKCISNCLNTHMKFLNVLNYLDTPQTGYEPTTLGFVLFASAPQTGYLPRTLGILSFVLFTSSPRIFISN